MAEDLVRWTGLAWKKHHDVPRSLPSTFDAVQIAALPGHQGWHHRAARCAAQLQYITSLIQLWRTQFERGELTGEEVEASFVVEYGARFAALERKIGQLTMELDLVKKNTVNADRQRRWHPS